MSITSISERGTTEELKLQIARGQIPYHEVRNIFGWQGSTTTSFIPLWENTTAYTYPGSALNMTVTTSSASDDGGTVTLIGLDINYDIISETVTANNASAPTTTKGFFRINDVIFANSSGANVGTITVSNGGTTYAKILAGVGRNQASIYTVPNGYEYYLYRIDAFSNDSTAAKPGLFRNYVQYPTGAEYVVARTTFTGNMNIQRRLPFKYNSKTDIQFQLQTNSGTHEMNVFGEGILIDTTIFKGD
jgi:hypothetical protein